MDWSSVTLAVVSGGGLTAIATIYTRHGRKPTLADMLQKGQQDLREALAEEIERRGAELEKLNKKIERLEARREVDKDRIEALEIEKTELKVKIKQLERQLAQVRLSRARNAGRVSE